MNNRQTNSIIDQMEDFKNNYYSTQGKNVLFKKSQKLDCAKMLSQTIDLTEAINQTIFQVPNTNKIVFNYNVFKMYANPNNYDQITSAVIQTYDKILKNNATFEAHVILESFTISAAERYKDGIRLFCNKCMGVSTKYANLLSTMYIYHAPAMFESISTLLRPFVDPVITNRIVLYSKQDSATLLPNLFISS
jgi:hypothetical protein